MNSRIEKGVLGTVVGIALTITSATGFREFPQQTATGTPSPDRPQAALPNDLPILKPPTRLVRERK